jgi:hypothetical protein
MDAGHRGKRVLRAGRQRLDFSRNESGGPSIGVLPRAGADRRSSREGLMAEKSHGTRYVSVEPPREKRKHARETFSNEREAKQFARAKLVDTRNVIAGTLNPRPPKRPSPQRRCSYGLKNRMKTIWLERASTAHARNYPPGKDHLRRGARRWRSGSPDLFLGLSVQPWDHHQRRAG